MLAWPPEVMSRIRNTASVSDMAKVFRGNSIRASKFVGSSCDDVCENSHQLLEDILYCSSRPSKTLLEKALELACTQMSKDEQQQVAERILSTLAFLRAKQKCMISGKKYTDNVRRLCLIMKKISNPDLANSLHLGAKKIAGTPEPLNITRNLKRESCRAFKESDAKKAKLPIASSSSSSSTKAMDHATELERLMKIYGLPTEKSKSDAVCEVLSSQEEGVKSSAATSATAAPTFVQYSTPTGLVRLFSNGQKQEAAMSMGPSGFAMAKFGDELIQTEVPNLLLTEPRVFKRPATLKRPAAAKAAVVVPGHEGEGEEEEELEEDAVVEPVDKLVAVYGKQAFQPPRPKPFVLPDGSSIYFTDASQQCYICMCKAGDSKKHLLVSVGYKMSKQFRNIVLQIWNALIKEQSVTKELALSLRKKLLR